MPLVPLGRSYYCSPLHRVVNWSERDVLASPPGSIRPPAQTPHLSSIRSSNINVCTSQVEGGVLLSCRWWRASNRQSGANSLCSPSPQRCIVRMPQFIRYMANCCFWIAETGREMRDGQRCRGAVTNDAWSAQHMVTCKATREAVEKSADCKKVAQYEGLARAPCCMHCTYVFCIVCIEYGIRDWNAGEMCSTVRGVKHNMPMAYYGGQKEKPETTDFSADGGPGELVDATRSHRLDRRKENPGFQ